MEKIFLIISTDAHMLVVCIEFYKNNEDKLFTQARVQKRITALWKP